MSYSLAAAHALLKYMENFQNVYFAPKSLKVEYQAPEDSTLIDADTVKHMELLHTSMPGGRSKVFLQTESMLSKSSHFHIRNPCSAC